MNKSLNELQKLSQESDRIDRTYEGFPATVHAHIPADPEKPVKIWIEKGKK